MACWWWVFLVNVPIGLGAMIAAGRLVPRSRDETVSRLPDLAGAGALALGVGAVTLALVEGPDWGWADRRVVVAWAVAVVATGVFLVNNSRHPAPLVEPALVRVRAFGFANLTAVLFAVPFAAGLLINILWMQQVWGYSAIRVASRSPPAP